MEAIIKEVLSKGVEIHIAGEFDLAGQLYSSVIKLDPNHADANHNMGLLKVDTGEALEALPYLQTALQADTSVAQFWLSYIKALLQLDRVDEATRVLHLAKDSGAEGAEFLELHQQLNEPTVEVEPVQLEADTSSQSKPNIFDTLNLDEALRLAKNKVKEGLPEEAKRIYQDILEKFPKNKRAQHGLAVFNKLKKSAATQGPAQDTIDQLIQLYDQGQFAAVVEQAQTLTEKYPGAFIVWNILGAALNGLEKTVEASTAFKKVTELNPTYDDGFNNLGVTLKDQGKLDEAIAAYKKALSLKPDHAKAYNNLGVTLQEQGKLDEAIAAYKKALSLKPDYAEAYNNMGVTLQEQGKLAGAIEAYNKALAINPEYAEAYNNMGAILQEQGKLAEATGAYNKALTFKPDYAQAHNNMGNALQEQGKLDEAIAAYNNALSLKPDHADAYNNMGNALKEQGKLDEAIATYNQALSLKPDHADAYNNMGNALKDQGKLDEAIASFKKALSLKPDHTGALKNISSLIKYKYDDTQVAVVNEMIQRSDLKDEDRCHLHYTFAKMSEDLDDLGAAYNHYVAGGKLKQKLLSYDFKQDELKFNQVKNTAPKFKELVLDNLIEATTNTPIFILGMPRSGTTLVEQIISSHSQVHGAGEIPLLGRFGGTLSFGNQIVNSDNVIQIRNAYLTELEKISNGCHFVTDKLPHNFQFIALILTALPEVKVIHVKRDPAATCWSNFKHYFDSKGLGYSYDLANTVGYFRLYQDLMDFWDKQYSDQIYHLDYDKLTREQESETRGLIRYIGLDWEDNCLSPHENKRSVRTASQRQVREKVYTGSSQTWRKFKPYLNGVFDEFEHSSAPPPN